MGLRRSQVAPCATCINIPNEGTGRTHNEGAHFIFLICIVFMKKSSFSTWKVILVGTYTTVDELAATLLAAGFRIGSWANDVLRDPHFTLAKEKQEVRLARVTPHDLGFPQGAYRKDIYATALSRGLLLCSPEIGPYLRLAYGDQSRLESLQIGMEPQKDSLGHESEFRVVHGADGFLWLVGDHRHPDDFWKENEPFIFRLP